jgi:hypothetical protein
VKSIFPFPKKGTFLLRGGFDGIEALRIGFLTESNQFFGTGRETKAAGFAPLSINANFPHI